MQQSIAYLAAYRSMSREGGVHWSSTLGGFVLTPTKGPDDQLCLRKLTSGSSTPLVRSYSRVDNHRAVIVYARAAYHPAYLKCCIPGMQHPHIRPLALPRYAGMQRYATGMQYAGMQRYAVCNSMHSPSGEFMGGLVNSPGWVNSPRAGEFTRPGEFMGGLVNSWLGEFRGVSGEFIWVPMNSPGFG